MKTWFPSLGGAIALSFAHLMIELWRAFLDFSFVVPDYAKRDEGQILVFSLIYAAIFAVWILGLRKAGSERRGGLIAALVVGSLFLLAIDLGTILFYCPGGCSRAAFNIASWGGLVVGVLAVVALAMALRRKGAQAASA